MAQHYPVDLEMESKVQREIKEIGKEISLKIAVLKEFRVKVTEFHVMNFSGKSLMFLPEQYHTEDGDYFVIDVHPFDLKMTKKEWGAFWENASLECHFKEDGSINRVFYPL